MGKKKVAIIGAGCFGSTIATDLAKQGFSVSIFEKNSILGGSTYGSIRRVHSGPHYPRHLPTALQSRLGYDSFLKRFSDAIFSNFPNYYAIAKDLSRTSSEDFVSFLELAQVPNQRVDVRELHEFGVRTGEIEGAWNCPEAVIDLNVWRSIVANEFDKFGVEVYLGIDVKEILGESPNFSLASSEDIYSGFSAVIRTTYALDRIRFNGMAVNYEPFEFQKTLVLKIKTARRTFGLTVLDGDFLTYLPCGFEPDSFLAYAPSPSVTHREISTMMPESFLDIGSQDLKSAELNIRNRIGYWLQNTERDVISESIKSCRVIRANVTATDERESLIKIDAPGLLSVFSGKLDHCIEVSNRVQKLVE